MRVSYPKSRRVLLDGDDIAPTNRIFRVERGTNSFAIDELADPLGVTALIGSTYQ